MRYHGHFQDSPTGGVKLNMGKLPKIATFHPLIHHHFPHDNCHVLGTSFLDSHLTRQLPYKTYEKDSSPDSDDEEHEADRPLGPSGEAAV